MKREVFYNKDVSNKLQYQRLAGPMILACKKLCYKIWSKNCVGFCVNQRAGTPFLQDRRSENDLVGWRLACIELRKMANRASIGKGSLCG